MGGFRRISREGTMEFRQWHSECELVVLHLRHDEWRHAVPNRVGGSVAARGVGAEGAGRHRGYVVGDGDARHRQSGLHGRRCVRAGKAQLFARRYSGRDRTVVQSPRLVCDGVDTIGGECTGHRARCDREPCGYRCHGGLDHVGASVARPADGAGPHRRGGGDRQRRPRLCVRCRRKAVGHFVRGRCTLGSRDRAGSPGTGACDA